MFGLNGNKSSNSVCSAYRSHDRIFVILGLNQNNRNKATQRYDNVHNAWIK
jgi:hypothetical protein